MTRRFPWTSSARPALVATFILLSAAALQSARFGRQHKALAAELATLRGDHVQPTAAEQAAVETEIARISAELTRQAAELEQAEAAMKQAQKELPPMTGEELRSLGRMEDFARKAAALIEQIAELSRLMKDPAAKSQSDEVIGRVTQQMAKWASWLAVIGQMEESPTEIGQLHAQTIATRLGLDPAATTALEKQIANEFARLAESGLIRPQRPESIEETKDWNKRRSETLHLAAARLEPCIPAPQRKPWVVEQSLELGNAIRHSASMDSAGHGSANVALVLPGL